MDFIIDFLRSPFVLWGLVFFVGGIIYTILKMNWKVKDLEPIRKNAIAISETPKEMKEIGKMVNKSSLQIISLEGKVGSLNEKVGSLGEKVGSLGEKVGSLEGKVGSLEGKVGSLEGKVGSLEGKVGSLDGKVDLILNEIQRISVPPYTENNSPMSLNDKGKALSEEMDAPDIASKYKEKLIGEAKDRNTYQIQESCFDFAANEILKDLEKKDKEKFDHISNIAYNEGVQVEAIMRILGLVLRDQVLEAVKSSKDINKDIKTSDIISPKT